MPILSNRLGKPKLGLRFFGLASQISLDDLSKIFDYNPSNVNARGAANFIRASTQSLSATSHADLRPGDYSFGAGCWAKIASKPGSPNNQAVMSHYNAGDDRRSWQMYHLALTDEWTLAYSDDSLTFNTLTSTVAPVIDQWHFFFWWYDNAGTVNFAIDEETPLSAASNDLFANTVDPFKIGDQPGPTARPLDGAVDQAFVFKNPTESFSNIRAVMYNGGSGISYASLTTQQKNDFGLIAFWELDELSGVRADSHGSHDMTPVNDPLSANGLIEGPADDLDPVYSWVDSVKLTQDTISLRPTYRLTYIDFDGADDVLNYDDIILSESNFTHFLKVRIDSLPTTEAIFYCEEADDATAQYRVSVDSSGNLILKYKSSGESLTTLTGSVLSVDTDYVIAVVRDGTALRLYLDGSLDQAGSVAGSTMTGATVAVGGPVYTSSSEHLNGRIYRMVSSGPLNSAAVRQIGGQL